jgi:hypothetical protein
MGAAYEELYVGDMLCPFLDPIISRGMSCAVDIVSVLILVL